MGQYWKALTSFDGKICGWNLLPRKLMEHSWLHNEMTDFFSTLIFNTPHKIAWVGDYAEEKEIPPEWAEHLNEQIDFDPIEAFNYNGKVLVNHDKNQFVRFDSLPFSSEGEGEWIIYPLPLLTAVSNGRGGGDYYDTSNPYVGTWAFDLIEIRSVENIPDEYEEIYPDFKE